jgi:hypothetical protein
MFYVVIRRMSYFGAAKEKTLALLARLPSFSLAKLAGVLRKRANDTTSVSSPFFFVEDGVKVYSTNGYPV